MALTLDKVSYAYTLAAGVTQPALEGVSLSVAPGDLALVVGPSGSGKTTLLRLAAGIMDPSDGVVAADGARVVSGGLSNGAFLVGIAFQRPESQFFATSVEEDVSFGPRNHGATKASAAEATTRALTEVGLDPAAFGERSPFTLSGGEARRAALAGVLAMRPRYLLLDEPSAGLDARGRAAVRDAVAGARATAGVVVVTHDPEEFLEQADSVLVLAEGRQAFGGNVAELLAAAADLQASGLWAPPDLVRFQLLARAAGAFDGEPVLDVAEAAERLRPAWEPLVDPGSADA